LTIIYLDVDESEARRRLDVNRECPVRLDLPDEAFAMIAREMESPTFDEGVLTYRSSEPLLEWIEREISPLLAQPTG